MASYTVCNVPVDGTQEENPLCCSTACAPAECYSRRGATSPAADVHYQMTLQEWGVRGDVRTASCCTVERGGRPSLLRLGNTVSETDPFALFSGVPVKFSVADVNSYDEKPSSIHTRPRHGG